ncbi:MAG: hypothetical protein WCH20_05165 [Nitrospira sp.]|jgi:hypothetical protein
MRANDDEFFVKVAQALAGCQLVEQELKLYIAEALELAKKCIGHKIPFKMSGEDYADSSLERLIESFKKLSDNNPLVKELQAFKEERNFLSHHGIVHCLDPDGDIDYIAMVEFQKRLAAIEPEAQRLRLAVHEEANKFRGYLYFEDESNAG